MKPLFAACQPRPIDAQRPTMPLRRSALRTIQLASAALLLWVAPACEATSSPNRPGGAGGEDLDFDGGSGAGDPAPSPCYEEGATMACYGGDPAHAGVGACASGIQTCELQGEFFLWGSCIGWGGPGNETCDGLDNDCDGSVDEGNTCDQGTCLGEPGACDELPIPPTAPLGSTCAQPFPPVAGIPCSIDNPGPQYYVSSTIGSDSNDGTSPGQAWATLCHAVGAAPPGSTLEVAEGNYASSHVQVTKALTVKGGYDSTFASWDPDLHASVFYGSLTLDHTMAVWGGFRMISNPLVSDTWSHEHHRIGAGTLLRNYVEIVASEGPDTVLNLYGITASPCPGATTSLRCNDIYVRSDAPNAFVVDAIYLGGMQGKAVVDGNRVCVDQSPMSTASGVVRGNGTCGSAGEPATVTVTNNVLEISSSWAAEGMEFYGCDTDMDIVVTNNTILSDDIGIGGYEGRGGAGTLRWRLTNNTIFSMGGGYNAVDVGEGAVQIVSSEGNLAFGYNNNNNFLPVPLLSVGDDTSGATSAASVFVNPGAGDFRLLQGGPGVGTGVNVYGLPEYGTVTRDILQLPRASSVAWDRGAYAY